jgi:hypothetical protein
MWRSGKKNWWKSPAYTKVQEVGPRLSVVILVVMSIYENYVEQVMEKEVRSPKHLISPMNHDEPR